MGPLFVFHHGAGFSKESFIALEKRILIRLECETFAFDCRGHGENSSLEELDLQGMADDMEKLVNEKYKDRKDIILVGHR